MVTEQFQGKTVADLAQEALDIQNACNLSGVIHAWNRSISDLRRLFPAASTDWINQHPVNKMFASKVHDLTRMGLSDMDAYDKAHEECTALAIGQKS